MNAFADNAQLDFLSADVPDPTDFPPSDVAPGLRLLDEALRCSVCHELYDAPVTLNCGHCFCSLCVRNYLKDKKECPSCRKEASDTQLRKNVALESAVRAWAAAREFTLRLAKQEANRLARNASEESSRPRKRRRSTRSSGGSSSDEVEIVEGPSSSTSRRPAPSQKKQRPNKSPRTPDTPSTPTTPSSSDDLVDCPMCQRRVPFQIINQHIDSSCKLSAAAPLSPRKPKGKAQQEWSKILGGGAGPGRRGHKERDGERLKSPVSQPDDEPEYLPTVSYRTLKDKRIQELLHEHGLPTTGDRNAWDRRHQKWVMLYNANLDRAPSDRHTPDQLRRELQKWEASGAGGGSGGAGRKKAGEVKDLVAYQTAHKAEFAKLVEAARPKRGPQTSQSQSGQEEDVEDTAEQQQSDGDVGAGQRVMNHAAAS
ncbi:uncharacterized protein B0H18DRAFT_1006669 [Fomitopsis serialis]|uniref:uncharacterized protein n=1 Tax=Fomitopsis serialis TaxID=139415 RepID=UPI00200876C2|nr:uncharacterized protein B0H18DRAFT_1006669 [Neoantrodia serialis]KAH9926137.1 hypothetical protein B0H18DRAFT_1006669 [Neoantrodia serialis]